VFFFLFTLYNEQKCGKFVLIL